MAHYKGERGEVRRIRCGCDAARCARCLFPVPLPSLMAPDARPSSHPPNEGTSVSLLIVQFIDSALALIV